MLAQDWFTNLFGRTETANVHEFLRFRNGMLSSSVNNASYRVGSFALRNVKDLRAGVQPFAGKGRLTVSLVVGDVQRFHVDPANRHATFQVASQFNCLEMVAPQVTPEHGVTRYQADHTQGPACAICCGAATVFRNYFVLTGSRRPRPCRLSAFLRSRRS